MCGDGSLSTTGNPQTRGTKKTGKNRDFGVSGHRVSAPDNNNAKVEAA